MFPIVAPSRPKLIVKEIATVLQFKIIDVFFICSILVYLNVVGNKSTTTAKITLTPMLPNAMKIADCVIVVGIFLDKYIVIAVNPDINPNTSEIKSPLIIFLIFFS